MKIVCALVVLMSVAAASAGVRENVKVYNPTLSDSAQEVVRPVKTKPVK